MNINPWKRKKVALVVLASLASGMILTSCGGGSVASAVLSGIGGTGIVFGPLTGFGSVYVNGRRFDTSETNFVVDGNTNATQDDLRLGMVLRLEAELDENGAYTGKAVSVEYGDDIEGPIRGPIVTSPDGAQKTFSIFGQTIIIDETSTIFSDTDFTGIAIDDVVEVSGYRVSSDSIEATYIGFKGPLVLGSTEVEMHGQIADFSIGPPQTFSIDGVTVTIDGMTEVELPDSSLANGLNVEVEGVLLTADSILATKVELDSGDFNEDVESVSLHGVVSDFVSLASFQLAGLTVDASAAEISPANGATLVADGVEIEVEGDIIGGILVADELEIEEGEAEVEASVGSVSPGTGRFEVYYASLLGRVVVRSDGSTLFEDETEVVINNFSINDLNVDDIVKVEGRELDGELVAKVVKRVEPDDLSLQGAVDDFESQSWIEILGIRYSVDTGTDYGVLDAVAFFDQLSIGDIVEIEDELIADGIADSVEFDD